MWHGFDDMRRSGRGSSGRTDQASGLTGEDVCENKPDSHKNDDNYDDHKGGMYVFVLHVINVAPPFWLRRNRRAPDFSLHSFPEMW